MAHMALQARAGMQMTGITMLTSLTVGSISMEEMSHMADSLGMKGAGTMDAARSRSRPSACNEQLRT
jgi:hypothetical protein